MTDLTPLTDDDLRLLDVTYTRGESNPEARTIRRLIADLRVARAEVAYYINAADLATAEAARLGDANAELRAKVERLHELVAKVKQDRREAALEVQRLRLAAAWAEGVISEEWGGRGPTGDEGGWKRFRAALDAPTTAWTDASGS